MYIADNDAGFDAINEYFHFAEDTCEREDCNADCDGCDTWVVPAKEDLCSLDFMLGEINEEPGRWRRLSFISLFDYLSFDIGYEVDGLKDYLQKALKFADYDIKGLQKNKYGVDVTQRVQEIELFKSKITEKYN